MYIRPLPLLTPLHTISPFILPFFPGNSCLSHLFYLFLMLYKFISIEEVERISFSLYFPALHFFHWLPFSAVFLNSL